MSLLNLIPFLIITFNEHITLYRLKRRDHERRMETKYDSHRTTYRRSRIFNDSISVRELLHTSGLVGELPVDEPARLVEDVWPAGVLEEPLGVLAIPIQLNIHVFPISTADRFHHFLYRRTAIDWKPVLASFVSQNHVHLSISHPLGSILQSLCPGMFKSEIETIMKYIVLNISIYIQCIEIYRRTIHDVENIGYQKQIEEY